MEAAIVMLLVKPLWLVKVVVGPFEPSDPKCFTKASACYASLQNSVLAYSLKSQSGNSIAPDCQIELLLQGHLRDEVPSLLKAGFEASAGSIGGYIVARWIPVFVSRDALR